jgi:hypothetical protein
LGAEGRARVNFWLCSDGFGTLGLMSESQGVQQEASHLTRLFSGRDPELLTLLSGQLSVLKSQGQTLLGLCGLCITVTGFSGHLMVRGAVLSTLSMVGGIFMILVAAVMTIRIMAALRWVTQDLGESMEETARVTLARRNKEQRALSLASAFVAMGLAGYLLAVVLAAVTGGQAGAGL